jgi:uncharacterized protein (TIGR04141 family)
MAKTQSFSIYLLKDGVDHTVALKAAHALQEIKTASNLPPNSFLYLQDRAPRPPWWKDFFGISQQLGQVSKGALLFLAIEKRIFALCFGHVSHNLKEGAFEYDFGLKVTLNCVDPSQLRSTDSLEPGVGRRQRTQSPIGSDLTYFDFDRDSSILRRLTGKVKEKYRPLFKSATGASNLRIGTSTQSQNLPDLCVQLLALYKSEEYKKTFPDIQNILPVKDPEIIKQLDGKLLEALRQKSEAISLAVPDLINYEEDISVIFHGEGESQQYDDVFINAYYEYLSDNEVELSEIDIDDLRGGSLRLLAEDGSPRGEHSIYKSLIFDASLGQQTEVFHLTEGHWYKVETNYIVKLRNYLDPLCVESNLPDYQQNNEGEYNQTAAANNTAIICADQTDISPTAQTQIEPCDLYEVIGGEACFHHVKISTHSSKLSHLFNQGVNAIEILKLEPESEKKFEAIIKKLAPQKFQELIQPIKERKFYVAYQIVTNKDKKAKSNNLPLFSRISLMHAMKRLQLMSVRGSFSYIANKTPKKPGRKKGANKKPA